MEKRYLPPLKGLGKRGPARQVRTHEEIKQTASKKFETETDQFMECLAQLIYRNLQKLCC